MAARVLVADDHHDGAEALGRLLQALGCDVLVTYSGEEALQAAPSFRPCLVILDIEMPGLSGLETARLMRQQPWARTAVFASHSGASDPKIADISRHAGFRHHVPKPARLEVFKSIVDALDDA